MKRPEPPPGLTESILEATSGPTCAAARDRICGWVDGTLGELDADLVRMHAGSCEECTTLAGVLRAMARDLPALAELDPGPEFTASVVAATERMRPVPIAARLAAAWQRLIERPRFAWEGAYIGGFVLVLIFGTPGSPFAGVPQQALALAATNPVHEIREPVAQIEESVSSEIRSAWDSTSGKVSERSRRLVGKIKGGLAGLLESIGSGEEKGTDDGSTEPAPATIRHAEPGTTETDDPNAPGRRGRDRQDGEQR